MSGSSVNPSWRELSVPSRRQGPKLFYHFNTDIGSLTLLLTDLVSLWECALDRQGILAEASRQRTTIDPSVSSAQFNVLLSKLAHSLADGANTLAQDGKRGSFRLILRTTAALPKPLKPLQWAFRLAAQDASEMARRILQPCLHEVSASQAMISSLLRTIKDKDHVMSRLLERIDNTGVDLGLVFPSISALAARRGAHISVTDAKKHVPGMAAFDEDAWRQHVSHEEIYQGADSISLSNLVRGCEGVFHQDWIHYLPSSADLGDALDLDQVSEEPTAQKASSSPQQDGSDGESIDSHDDFERQATPPHLQTKSPPTGKVNTTAARRTSTEDEREDSPPSTKPAASRLGGLRQKGTKTAPTSSPVPKHGRRQSSKPTSPASSTRRASDASTATATATPSNQSDKDDSPSTKLPDSKRDREARRANAKEPSRKATSPRSSPAPTPPVTRSRAQDNEDETCQLPNDSRSSSATESDIGGDLDLDASPDPKPSTQRGRRLGRLKPKEDTATSRDQSSSTSDQDLARPTPALASDSESTGSNARATSNATRQRRLGRLGDHKARLDTPSNPPSPRSSKKSDKGRGNDGNIAGKHRDPTASPSPVATRHSKQNPPTAQSTDASDASNVTPSEDQPPPTPPEAAEVREETEEQKANRRRQELKRTIASGAGGRKKRRF